MFFHHSLCFFHSYFKFFKFFISHNYPVQMFIVFLISLIFSFLFLQSYLISETILMKFVFSFWIPFSFTSNVILVVDYPFIQFFYEAFCCWLFVQNAYLSSIRIDSVQLKSIRAIFVCSRVLPVQLSSMLGCSSSAVQHEHRSPPRDAHPTTSGSPSSSNQCSPWRWSPAPCTYFGGTSTAHHGLPPCAPVC